MVWWPGLSTDIAAYIAECDTCIKHGAVKHQPHFETPLPEGPWEEVGTDVFVFAGCLYLVIVDYYTRWIEAPLISAQSTAVVVATLKSVFSRMGVPGVVRSDNGPCFKGREFASFAGAWGFRHVTSSPRYPQSNGMAERAVGIVKGLWRKSACRDGALMAYRCTPLRSGFSPSQLMFGRTVRSTIGKPKVVVNYELFEETERAEREHQRAKWNLKFSAKSLPVLKPGQQVWVKSPTDIGKEGVVLRADDSPESYWVQLGQSEVRRNRKHLFILYGDSDFSEGTIVPMELDSFEFRPRPSDEANVSVGVDLPSAECSPPVASASSSFSRVELPDLPFSSQTVANPARANVSVGESAHNSASDIGITNNDADMLDSNAPQAMELEGANVYISPRSNRSTGEIAGNNDDPEMSNSNVELDSELSHDPAFIPVPDRQIVTRSGRVSKPPDKLSYVYYD